MTLQVNRLMEKAESRLLVNVQSVSVHLVILYAVGKYTNQTQDKQNKAVTVLTAKNLMRNGTKKSGYY